MEMENINSEELKLLKQKAEKYDEIENNIAKFYDDEDDGMDLCDIGEFIAAYFGWI